MHFHLAISLVLTPLNGRLAVCQLDPGVPLPAWATQGEFWSIARTAGELSIVCAEDSVPPGVTCQPNWRGLKVAGPLDFSLTGVLASLAVPLAEAGVSIFAISTYDTDYLLVQGGQLEAAVDALRRAGHTVA
jgi:hypothetical protein